MLATVNFNEMSVDDICEYLQYKHYSHLSSNFDLLNKYFQTCNMHEKDNDDTHGMIRILVDKLEKDVQLLIKNDTYILFPKIRNDNEKIQQKTIDVFRKIHQNILQNLDSIKKLFNHYNHENYWNSYTQLSMIEMKQIDETIRNIIYLKETYLWDKLKNIAS